MGILLLIAFWLLMIYGSVNGYPYRYPREDLVDRLPGQPKVGFKQFAGYVDVDEQAGRSLFYYFVEAQQDAHILPLTLWLNGGPGCSSMGGGAFTEIGPFNPTGDGRGLRRNSKSWNKASNLLFIESPAGVGWSYSNTTSDYISGDDLTAQDLVRFFLRWFEKFPDLKSRSLFLTGESYAGHYIPQLANLLLDYNHQSKDFKFNIKGVAIGNPLLNPVKDFAGSYEFYWSHGMISDEVWESILIDCNFEDYTKPAHKHNVSVSCNEAINKADNIVGDYVDPFDVILDVCYPSIVEQQLRLRQIVTQISVGMDVCILYETDFYLNLPEVQKALHANRTSLPYDWSICSQVLNYTEADSYRNILPILERIIQNNIPVWIYSGDEDSVLPLIGTRTLVKKLAKNRRFETSVPYGAWFHKGQVGGWQIEYGNMLTYVTVRGASHMVPYSQPSRALHVFSDFVGGRRLPNTTKIPFYDD